MMLRNCGILSRGFCFIRDSAVKNALMHRTTKTSNIFSNRFSSIGYNETPILTNETKENNSIESNNQGDGRTLEYIKLEMSSLRHEGHTIPDPDSLKKHHWDELLKLKTKSARRRYYSYLFIIEKKKEKHEIEKEVKRQAFAEFKESGGFKQQTDDQHIIYSLSHTAMFLRIYETTMNNWVNNKLTRAIQFGDKLVFDCSYDEHMNRREAYNAAKQLMLSFAENRQHQQPFDLHFCNVNFNNDTMKCLERYIPTMRNTEFPLNLHEGSYLDLFPKEKLVYLTPHCQNDLVEYDSESVYIIGAMVDKMNQLPLSLGKAKMLGLKMARLPLDRYLSWGAGSGKSMTLNQMTNIMLDLKVTRNWELALRHVPRRKIINEYSQNETRRWIVNVDKFKPTNYGQRRDKNILESHKDGVSHANSKFEPSFDSWQPGGRLSRENVRMSTVDKFKKPFESNSRFKSDFDYPSGTDSTLSTAEKFKRGIRTHKDSEIRTSKKRDIFKK